MATEGNVPQKYEAWYQPIIRVYFNRRQEAPCVWSVDLGDPSSEICVQSVQINATSLTVYNGKTANDHEPVAWVQTTGYMKLIDGRVVIDGHP